MASNGNAREVVEDQDEQRLLDDLKKSLYRQIEYNAEIQLALLRLAVFGNAGGTIATLSFLGTTYSANGSISIHFIYILILFLLGLIIGAVCRAIDWVISKHQIFMLDNILNGGNSDSPSPRHARYLRRYWWIGLVLSYGAFIFGTAGGLFLLFKMTN